MTVLFHLFAVFPCLTRVAGCVADPRCACRRHLRELIHGQVRWYTDVQTMGGGRISTAGHDQMVLHAHVPLCSSSLRHMLLLLLLLLCLELRWRSLGAHVLSNLRDNRRRVTGFTEDGCSARRCLLHPNARMKSLCVGTPKKWRRNKRRYFFYGCYTVHDFHGPRALHPTHTSLQQQTKLEP